MNYFEAHKILDGLKNNASYNLDIINQALELTGDLDIAELPRKTSPASCRYGSEAWMDSLRQGKSAGT
jgi:hypothetical protein